MRHTFRPLLANADCAMNCAYMARLAPDPNTLYILQVLRIKIWQIHKGEYDIEKVYTTDPNTLYILQVLRIKNWQIHKGEYDIEKGWTTNARYTCMVYLDWLYFGNEWEEEQHNMFTTMEAKRSRKLCHPILHQPSVHWMLSYDVDSDGDRGSDVYLTKSSCL